MIQIKVLQVITGNDNGGGGIHVLNIYNGSKNKFECTLCFLGEGALYEAAKKNELEYIMFNKKDVIQGKLLKYLNSGFDIINFHGAKANFIHYILQNQIEPKCLVTIHSDYRLDFKNNRIKQLLFTPMSILGIKSFTDYICVSSHIKALLENEGIKGNKVVIGNGIDIISEMKLQKKEAFRELYGIEESDFLYLLLARLHPVKNHERLLEAFQQLNKELKNVKLMFVGDGALEQYLKDKASKLGIENNVIFAGYQKNTFNFINACDISMLISINEGATPTLSMLESGLMKKAMICSAIGDLPQIVNDDIGFLIDPMSVEDIYLKMKEAYYNKYKLFTMGENFYSLVKDKYSLESFINKYKDFYEYIST